MRAGRREGVGRQRHARAAPESCWGRSAPRCPCLGSAAAAAIAFFKEESGDQLSDTAGLDIERGVYKYLKKEGFEFELSENYGEPLTEGTYKVKHDIYNSEGEVVINIDEEVYFKETTDIIMGYDVFKHKDIYLTTEDLYV